MKGKCIRLTKKELLFIQEALLTCKINVNEKIVELLPIPKPFQDKILKDEDRETNLKTYSKILTRALYIIEKELKK